MIHLKIKPLEKAKHLNQASIFRFHVGFPGATKRAELLVRTASFWTSIISHVIITLPFRQTIGIFDAAASRD